MVFLELLPASRSGNRMFATAVLSRAEKFLEAWRTKRWLPADAYPAAPVSISEMYETHLAIQTHP